MYLLIENSQIQTGIKKRKCASKTSTKIRRKSDRTDNAFQLNIHDLFKDSFYGSFLFCKKRSDFTSIIIDNVEYFGIIYKIENTITHEVYIGQTSNPKGFDGRYCFHGKDIERVYTYLKGNKDRNERHNQHLRRSIEKYGFDVFKVDKIIGFALTMEELNKKEMYYIEKYDSYKNGYNQTYGGDNFPRGENCKNSKRVCQISQTGELIKIWNSATEASDELGISASSLSNVCNGKQRRKGGEPAKTAGGYVWVFEKNYDCHKDYSINRPRQNMGHGSKSVLLLSNDGNILQEFYSINEASRQSGLSVEAIRETCMHKYKNPTHNFIYKSEYLEEQRLNVEDSVA